MGIDTPERCWPSCVAIPDGVDARGHLRLSIDLCPKRLAPGSGGIEFSQWPGQMRPATFVIEVAAVGATVWKPLPFSDDVAFHDQKFAQGADKMWLGLYTDIGPTCGEPVKDAFVTALDVWSGLAGGGAATAAATASPEPTIDGYSYGAIADRVHQTVKEDSKRFLLGAAARAHAGVRNVVVAQSGDRRRALEQEIDAPFEPARKISEWRALGRDRFPDRETLRRRQDLRAEEGWTTTFGRNVTYLVSDAFDYLTPAKPAGEPALQVMIKDVLDPDKVADARLSLAADQTISKFNDHFKPDRADASAEDENPPIPPLADQVQSRITALQAHPTLRKYLHLIADVTFDPADLKTALGPDAGKALIRVRAVGSKAPATVDPQSETVFRYDAAAREFEPCSEFEFERNPRKDHIPLPLVRGAVALADTQGKRFRIESIDAVAAVNAFVSQAANTKQAHDAGVPLQKVPTGKPEIRTRGIMILDGDAEAAAKRSAAREDVPPGARRLYAEDLINGYRPLVAGPQGQLLSPVARRIVYPVIHTYLGEQVPAKADLSLRHPYPDFAHRDYGVVVPTSRVIEERDASGKPVTRLSESEVLLTWGGEPMGIPSLPELDDQGRTVRTVFADKTDLPIEMWIGPDAAAKLPPLRRSSRYKFMLLACKPNGSSIPIASAKSLLGQQALGDVGRGNDYYVYRTAERVPGPDILVPMDDALVGSAPEATPNEAAETLVVRSGVAGSGAVSRILLPGAVVQSAAEQARQFDQGDFNTRLKGVHRYLKQGPHGGYAPVPRKNTTAADGGSAGFLFKSGTNAKLAPIYVDPLSRNLGAAFRRNDGRPVGYSKVPPRIGFWAKGDVPTNDKVRPIVLTLRARTPASDGNYKLGRKTLNLGGTSTDAYELFVDVAPAEHVQLDLWTFGDFAESVASLTYVEDMAATALQMANNSSELRQLMNLPAADRLDGHGLDELRSAMLGNHTADATGARLLSALGTAAEALVAGEPVSALSAITTVTLVHAVRQPLEKPAFLGGGQSLRFVRIVEKDSKDWAAYLAGKDEGDSTLLPQVPLGASAYAVGALKIHRASTGAVSAEGGWKDYGSPDALRKVNGRWEHHPVFRAISFDVPGIPRVDDAAGGATLPLIRDEMGALRFCKVRIETVDAKPDTIARRVALRLIGTSRFTDYFAPGLDFTEESARPEAVRAALDDPSRPSSASVASFWMPATRRPDRPVVTEETLIRQYASTPSNGGAKLAGSFRTVRRLYLGDRWFQSGEGEMLALILLSNDTTARCDPSRASSDKNNAAAESAMRRESIDSLISAGTGIEWVRPYATQWAGDITMRSSPFTSDVPLPHLIQGWAAHCGGLLLPSPTEGQAAAPVSIFAFQPLLDPVRGEWYCDIEVDAENAYTAMIRLGLARYQPHAIAGSELSLPLALEPYPLQPSWDVEINRTRDMIEVDVAGAGYFERAPGVMGLPGGDTAATAREVSTRTQAPNLQFRLAYADTGVQVIDADRPVIDVRLSPGAGSAGRPVWIGKLPIPTDDRNRPLRVLVSEVITHANADAERYPRSADPLVTVPASFSFDATMPPLR